MTARIFPPRVTRRQKMLNLIIAAGPSGIRPRDLVALVYDDADGGPLSAPSLIHEMAHRLKRDEKIIVEGKTWEAIYKAKEAVQPACGTASS